MLLVVRIKKVYISCDNSLNFRQRLKLSFINGTIIIKSKFDAIA